MHAREICEMLHTDDEYEVLYKLTICRSNMKSILSSDRAGYGEKNKQKDKKTKTKTKTQGILRDRRTQGVGGSIK